MKGNQLLNEMAKVLRYYGLAPDIMQSEVKITCPLHDDIRPSMKVDVSGNRFYCFGCGRFGDAKDLVYGIESKYHKLNDLQAYQRYIKILNSDELSDVKIIPPQKRFERTNKELYDIAYDYYHGLSSVDWKGELASPEEEEALDYMNARGYSADTLNYAKAKVTYQEQYSIIFPMLDNGKFKGWVSRTMDIDVQKYRKYLYNTGFSRATTLCGNYGEKPYVFVVEGYMDMLRFIQYGETNVVAILGWKMSNQQEKKLKALGIETVISALDNDKAGKKGTDYLKTIFNVVRFQYLKGIKDPGEMSKQEFDKCYRRTMQKFQDERKS